MKISASPSSGCSSVIRLRPFGSSPRFGVSGLRAATSVRAANCWPRRSSGLPTEPTEARASALVGAGLLAAAQNDYGESRRLQEDGLADARAAGSARIEATALSLLSSYEAFGWDEQIRLGEEAIALARTTGDRGLLGLVTGNHGVLMARFGEIEKAIELTDEAYRLCRGVGDVSLTALWLSNLAGYALEGGNTAEARRRLDESLELARLIDDTRETGQCAGHFRLGRPARRRSRARVLVLRGGGGDRTKARGAVARRRSDLGLRPSRSRRRRRRPRGAPRGGRARARWIRRIRPGRR